MNEPTDKDSILLRLAAEGLVPIVDGCAAALAGTPPTASSGIAVVPVVEKAINLFGGRIVERWRNLFRDQPEAERLSALTELASLTPEQARDQAEAALRELKPDAHPDDRSIALEYLVAIPRTVERALVREHGRVSISVSLNLEEPQALFLLLPTDVPPYEVPGPLAGTPYRLEQLLGSGGFGAVYRASAASLQHLPLAIKFCLDKSLVAALRLERDNLERLMKAGGEGWSQRIVRLYGYDLDYRTPFLVYEYVPGGDLQHHLTRLRLRAGRPLNADEVFAIVVQIAEALGFAHSHGLVHRDLKPANILVDGGQLKLADFGLGGVTAARAQVSRIGSTTITLLTAAEQASLFRGAGTPLYMSPEQRRGANPDARHDLYSLGVIWYQLLINDTARELHAGWAKELTVRFGVPAKHISLLESCVGWFDERPKDGAELLARMRDGAVTVQPVTAQPLPQPEPLRAHAADRTERLSAPDHQSEVRRGLFAAGLRRLARARRVAAASEQLPLLPMLLISMIAGWFPGHLVGELIYSALHPTEGFFNIVGGRYVELPAIIVGIVVGLTAAGLFFAGQLWYRWRRRQATADEADRHARVLAEEHAASLAAWGGPALLETSESVEALVRAVESSPTVMPLDNARRERLRHALHAALLDGMSRVVGAAEARYSPPWIAVPIAWLLGHIFGETVYTCTYPQYGFFNTFAHGRPLNVWIVLAGIAMGVTWLVILVRVQYLAWRWNVARLTAAADRFEAQLRALFPEYASSGGITGLRDADAVALVARRAAGHESLTQPATPELRAKLLAELRELLDMQERKAT